MTRHKRHRLSSPSPNASSPTTQAIPSKPSMPQTSTVSSPSSSPPIQQQFIPFPVVDDRLHQENDRLRQENKRLRQDKDRLQQELSAARNRYDETIRELHQRHANDIKNLSDTNTELKEEVARLKEENAALHKQVDELKQQLKDEKEEREQQMKQEKEERKGEVDIEKRERRKEVLSLRKEVQSLEKMVRAEREDYALLMQYVREQRLNDAKMSMGEHAWLLKMWLLSTVNETRSRSLHLLPQKKKEELLYLHKLSEDDFTAIKQATTKFGDMRAEHAHNEHQKDLDSKVFMDRLDTVAKSEGASMKELGLMLREWLRKVNASFAELKTLEPGLFPPTSPRP